MRILIDECIPRKFKYCLAPHDCLTVPEAGFAGKKNELLRLADGNFDIFVTLDRGLEFQQNMQDKKIAILVIRSKTNRLLDLQPHASACLACIDSIQPGQLALVE